MRQGPAVPGVEAVSQRPPWPGCHSTAAPERRRRGRGRAGSPRRDLGTAGPAAGPPCASVLCAAAAAAQRARHTALLLVLFDGFTGFFSDVTHQIARDGELLHLEFHLIQLPQRIPFITGDNGTEKLPTTLVGKQNSQALATQF